MKSNKHCVTRFLPTLFCLLAFMLVACGNNGGAAGTTTPNGSNKASADKQIYVSYIVASHVRSLDPPMAPDEGTINYIQQLFTGLVEVDDQLNVHLQMAASYEQSTDGLKWTFKLKPNLKFSDGASITSQDVIYSIDRALKPSLKSPNTSYLALVKDSDQRLAGKIPTLINDSLLAPDPQTVVIILNQKAAYFLETLTFPSSFVVEKSMIDKYGDTDYINHLSEGGESGPWILSKSDSKGIEFTPNPNYYGPHPQLKKVVRIYYQQSDTVYKAYQTNQVDASGVPTAHLADAKALPSGQLHQVPQLWITWLGMNYLVKPFDNIKVRQAFELAIDKDSIAHNVYLDKFQPTNHIVPKGQPGYSDSLTGPDGTTSTKGDPAKAKELFQQGLQEDGLTLATLPPIALTLSSSGSADTRNAVAAMQQMWQSALGINVKINDIDYTKFLHDQSNSVNNPNGIAFWFNGWVADYPDPQDWTTLQFDKGSSINYDNYGQNNASDVTTQVATQKLLEQADANTDNAARMKQYN
ncbi:MAG TPA: peptide ABC transporter substrate-binding protein, partial [Ktedonosporobacter sp.]|nr:peptide ABC transporter substrate-binding protein [Ktedonosporobacter sp.]